MIFLAEHHLIVSFGFKIRRLAIKKGIRSVILTDECLNILILDHGILQPAVCLPDDGKGFAYVKRLAAIRGAVSYTHLIPINIPAKRNGTSGYACSFSSFCFFLFFFLPMFPAA